METHRVLMVGSTRSGKTTLCMLWSGCVRSTSYVSTITIQRYSCRIHSEYKLLLYDTPSNPRFLLNMERYYARSDVIIMVARTDTPTDDIYSAVSPWAPLATWVLVLTSHCPKWHSWAQARSVDVIDVDLNDPTSVRSVLDCVVNLCQNHAPRQVLTFESDAVRPTRCV